MSKRLSYKMKKSLTKNKTIILLLIFSVITLVIIFLSSIQNQPITSSSSSSGTKSAPIVYGVAAPLDFDNFENLANENSMIKDLPEDSIIQIDFYNFNSGERIWEDSYVITKEGISKGTTSDAQIKIILHSKYLTVLNEDNFCKVVKRASSNGDLGYETGLSSIELAWKFKSMMKYKDC